MKNLKKAIFSLSIALLLANQTSNALDSQKALQQGLETLQILQQEDLCYYNINCRQAISTKEGKRDILRKKIPYNTKLITLYRSIFPFTQQTRDRMQGRNYLTTLIIHIVPYNMHPFAMEERTKCSIQQIEICILKNPDSNYETTEHFYFNFDDIIQNKTLQNLIKTFAEKLTPTIAQPFNIQNCIRPRAAVKDLNEMPEILEAKEMLLYAVEQAVQKINPEAETPERVKSLIIEEHTPEARKGKLKFLAKEQIVEFINLPFI